MQRSLFCGRAKDLIHYAKWPKRPKRPSKWIMSDLDSYNITLLHQNAVAFFGKQHLPQSQVDPEILNVQNASDMTITPNQELIHLLDLAMIPTCSPAQSAVNDFTVCLFQMLHYTSGDRVARTNKHIHPFIRGKYKYDNIDVCLLDCHHNDLMLVVQEDEYFGDQEMAEADAEAQLIAKAVAAFNQKNCLQWETGQPLLESQVIPGIVMSGTLPTFFKIPITQQLVTAIKYGEAPAHTTTVAVHLPELARPNLCQHEGMKPLDNRQQIMSCYEAFKGIIGI